MTQWHMATPLRPAWGSTVQALTFPGVVEAMVTEANEPEPDVGYTSSLYSVPPPASWAMMRQCHQPVFCPAGGEKMLVPRDAPAASYIRMPQLPPPKTASMWLT